MTTRLGLVTLIAAIATLPACGSDDDEDSKSTLNVCKVSDACGATVAEPPDEGAGHVADCSPVTYTSNPPSSGSHYNTWGAFGVYDSPLPRGFYVHSMEHGAVVISYQPTCTEDLPKAKELVAKLSDPKCDAPRVILTPDPLLDTCWAASAWGVTLRATCFNADDFACFFEQHVGKAPEDICSPHPSFLVPSMLGAFPANCGS